MAYIQPKAPKYPNKGYLGIEGFYVTNPDFRFGQMPHVLVPGPLSLRMQAITLCTLLGVSWDVIV